MELRVGEGVRSAAALAVSLFPRVPSPGRLGHSSRYVPLDLALPGALAVVGGLLDALVLSRRPGLMKAATITSAARAAEEFEARTLEAAEDASKALMRRWLLGHVDDETTQLMLAGAVGLDGRMMNAAVSVYAKHWAEVRESAPRMAAAKVDALARERMQEYADWAKDYRSRMLLTTAETRTLALLEIEEAQDLAHSTGGEGEARYWRTNPGACPRCSPREGMLVITAAGTVVEDAPPLHPWCRCFLSSE